MTKHSFIQRQQAMNRGMNRRLAGWVIFFFGALFACIPLTRYIERHEADYRWIGTAFMIGFLVFLFGNLGLMVWFGLKQQKQFGHRCPACRQRLIGTFAHVAIASGHCGQCGEPVFEPGTQGPR